MRLIVFGFRQLVLTVVFSSITSAQLPEIEDFLRQQFPSNEIIEKYRYDLSSFFSYEGGPDSLIAFVEAVVDSSGNRDPGRINIFGCDGFIITIDPAEMPPGKSVYESDIFINNFPKIRDTLAVSAEGKNIELYCIADPGSPIQGRLIWERLKADPDFYIFDSFEAQISVPGNIIILPAYSHILAYNLAGDFLWKYDYPDTGHFNVHGVDLSKDDGAVIIYLLHGSSKRGDFVILSRDGEELSRVPVNASFGVFLYQPWGPVGFHDDFIFVRFLVTENGQHENATILLAGDRRNPSAYLVRGFWHLLDGCKPKLLIGIGRKEPLVRAFALPQ